MVKAAHLGVTYPGTARAAITDESAERPIWILDKPIPAIDAEAEEQLFAELQCTKPER